MIGGFHKCRSRAQRTTVSAAGGRAFRVLAQARTAQGAVFVREALVEFVADQPGAYLFGAGARDRRRRGTAGRTRLPDTDLPPC